MPKASNRYNTLSRIRKSKYKWARAWLRVAGLGAIGRFAYRMAGLFEPPYYGLVPLAGLSARGYIAPSATICHKRLVVGRRCLIGERVLIYQDTGEGRIRMGDGVHIHRDGIIQTGSGGRVVIGNNTHIQPRCQISAYLGSVEIGEGVEIAPNCAFYPYDHGVAADSPIAQQPLTSKGGIEVGDGAWLGVGVIVLDGVRIGMGSVIGAGSVVTRDIPDGAIAVGAPARVVKTRGEASADAAARVGVPSRVDG